jgi:hypothetical protein
MIEIALKAKICRRLEMVQIFCYSLVVLIGLPHPLRGIRDFRKLPASRLQHIRFRHCRHGQPLHRTNQILADFK